MYAYFYISHQKICIAITFLLSLHSENVSDKHLIHKNDRKEF